MFGFVVVNEQDLSEAEMMRYRQVYCGVCRALHRQSGQLSRLTLNHDLTFMALIHLSLYEPIEETGTMRCLMHPIDQRPYTANDCVEYAADMTVVMAYHKFMDNWNDDRHHPSFAFAQALKGRYRAIKTRYERQCRAVEEGLARISERERAWNPADPVDCSDEVADIFGRVLAEVFVMREDIWADSLRAFGYELGRFIYMMDAAMDREDDRESGSFNPFSGHEFTDEEMRLLLASYMARATAIFERLPLVQDDHILRSVLYAGVWQRFNERVLKKESADESRAGENSVLASEVGLTDRIGSPVGSREKMGQSMVCEAQNDAAPVEIPQCSACTEAQSAIIQPADLGANEQEKEPACG